MYMYIIHGYVLKFSNGRSTCICSVAYNLGLVEVYFK